MDKYMTCMTTKQKKTAMFHKVRADKLLDAYFEELEKEIVD
jgi:hypothetical protein